MPHHDAMRLSIRTPEGVTFSLMPAGPIARFLAWTIDIALIGVASSLLSTVLSYLPWVGNMILILSSFALVLGYGIALEWLWRGQTVGKRILRLRVIDADGLNLQFSQVVLRNLLRVADALPMLYLVGGISCLVTRHCRRLGDIAAGTAVVHTPRPSDPDASGVLGGKFNSFREYPNIQARLRNRVTPREAALALQALARRDELDPIARVETFREIADHFRAAAPFPEEATLGIADEQYVRNVLDTVYNSAR